LNPEVLKIIDEAGMRLSSEAAALLDKMDDAVSVVKKAIELEPDAFILTPELVRKATEQPQDETKIPLPVEVHRTAFFKPIAAEHAPNLKFERHTEVSVESKRGGTLDNFVEYFNDRYRRTAAILKSRPAQNPIQSIASTRGMLKNSKVRIAGMVSSKRVTKNGTLLIEIEDETGVAKVLVMKDERSKAVFADASRLVFDEVVGIDGSVSEPFIFARSLLWPEVPIREPKRSERDLSIAFISDIHVASRFFMEQNFRKFLKWLNGDCRNDAEREQVGKIKYLVIAGDIVDGVGIYPTQERELVITDIYEQYKLFGQMIEDVPEHIEIIVGPGNHDAVRRAEPQPQFTEDLVKEMGTRKMHFTGSPANILIEDLRILMYHGTSLDSVIAAIPGMSYSQPEKPMVELLRRRNLSPIYGENPIVPEKHDYMVIHEVPDVMVMGHIHKNGYTNYRGTAVLNSGTWQDRTDYQRKQGHEPSPCLLSLYQTKYARLDMVDFYNMDDAKTI
jgi:DNA polymerase II small subunit